MDGGDGSAALAEATGDDSVYLADSGDETELTTTLNADVAETFTAEGNDESAH